MTSAVSNGVQPCPVFGFVGGIDHNQILVGVAAVNQQVVNYIGVRVHEVGVQRIADFER